MRVIATLLDFMGSLMGEIEYYGFLRVPKKASPDDENAASFYNDGES
jgi:hypothetical protein